MRDEVDNMSMVELVDFLEKATKEQCREICDVPPYINCPVCEAGHALNEAYDILRSAVRNIKGSKCAGQDVPFL